MTDIKNRSKITTQYSVYGLIHFPSNNPCTYFISTTKMHVIPWLQVSISQLTIEPQVRTSTNYKLLEHFQSFSNLYRWCKKQTMCYNCSHSSIRASFCVPICNAVVLTAHYMVPSTRTCFIALLMKRQSGLRTLPWTP